MLEDVDMLRIDNDNKRKQPQNESKEDILDRLDLKPTTSGTCTNHILKLNRMNFSHSCRRMEDGTITRASCSLHIS